VECLEALRAVHTDVSKPPSQRLHGAVCYGNVFFRRDGRALLSSGASKHQLQPLPYAAPEVRYGRADQQADIYAVGAMLLEALVERPLRAEEVGGLSACDLSSHGLWSNHASDPLLMVAARATAAHPERRWRTAKQFAEAIGQCGGGRIASLEDFVDSIDLVLGLQSDRATPIIGSLTASPSSPEQLRSVPVESRIVPLSPEVLAEAVEVEAEYESSPPSVRGYPINDVSELESLPVLEPGAADLLHGPCDARPPAISGERSLIYAFARTRAGRTGRD
jgi:serine/threonine protein kinase